MARDEVTIGEKRRTAAAANRRWRQHISSICREYTKDAVTCLVEIMNDAKGHTPSRVRAATEILNRGWGTSPVNVKVSDDGNTDLSNASDNVLMQIIAEQQLALKQVRDMANAEYEDDDYEDVEDDEEADEPDLVKKVH